MSRSLISASCREMNDFNPIARKNETRFIHATRNDLFIMSYHERKQRHDQHKECSEHLKLDQMNHHAVQDDKHLYTSHKSKIYKPIITKIFTSKHNQHPANSP